MRSRWTIALLALSLLGSAGASSPRYVAIGGFDRPRLVAEPEAAADVTVALLHAQEAPRVLWEGPEGVWSRPANGEAEAELLHEARGVRGVAAGRAGGDGWWAWIERDLRTGRYRVAWRWRDEERTVWEGPSRPELVAVRGADAPAAVLHTREGGRGRLIRVAWRAAPEPLHDSELELTGIDALDHEDRSWVGWLEGRTVTALGRADAEWTAYLLPTDSTAEPRRLGEAEALATGDGVRLGARPDGLHALWSAPGGALHWAAPGAEPRPVGSGRPVGLLAGDWFWYRDELLVRAPADAPGRAQPVVRLPAAPLHVVGLAHDGQRWLAWASGRFEGGAQVWAVDDRTPYRPGWRDRLAASMGWDPWRFWSSLAGQAAVAALLGVLLTAAATPLLWLASLTAQRAVAAAPAAQALIGAGMGAALLLTAAVAAAAVASGSGGEVPELLGGPGLTVAVLALAVAVSFAARRRADAEPTLGLLSAAWLACAIGASLWLFLTFAAWQEALAGLA